MIVLPLIRETKPGLYQLIADANTDYAIAVPEGAQGCVIWFEASASDAAMVRGRVGIDQGSEPVTGLDDEDDLLGYHPPVPVQYNLRRWTAGRPGRGGNDYLHVASPSAGAVMRGMWLYWTDDDEEA